MKEIMQGFKEVADHQAKLNEISMVYCMKCNMQGFKRWHRKHSKEFHNWGLYVDTCAIEYDGEVSQGSSVSYSPSSFKDHLERFIHKLDSDLSRLTKLNHAFFDKVGITFNLGKEMQEEVFRMHQKFKYRWYKHFEDTGWNAHDLYEFDRWLHTRLKEE